jgi:hypothetical protein
MVRILTSPPEELVYALDAYARGEGSLAFAARQAGVSLREIIPLAYARGLSPKVDSAELEDLQAGFPQVD